MIGQIQRNPPSSWKQRTHLERRGILLLATAILTIIGFIIGIVLVLHRNKMDRNASESRTNSICLSQGCVEAADQILKNIDQAVNPCDDFYQFACGGFINETEIPADKSGTDVFSAIDDAVKEQLKVIFEEPQKPNELKPFTLVKKLYNICMNTSAIELDDLTTIKHFFKDAGGWPILEGRRWNAAEFEWKKCIHIFRMLGLNMNSFIRFSVDSNSRTLNLDHTDLIIVHEILIQGFRHSVVHDYCKYLVDLAVFFGVDRKVAKHEVKKVVNFHIKIAKISLSEEQRRELFASNNLFTIEELQQSYPSLQWLDFINSVIGRGDNSISSNETVNVVVPEYIGGLLRLLSRTPKRVQANYAFFLAAYSLTTYLPDYVKYRELQFRALYRGTSILPPRWSGCTVVASRMLNLAVGALYVRKYFHEDVRQDTLQMVTDIKYAFVQILEKLDWMDQDTKNTAIDKVLSMTTHIGYPDEYLDDKKLEDYYEKLSITSGNYIRAITKINVFKTDIEFSQLTEPSNDTTWTHRMSAVSISAEYDAGQNSIEFPAGILQGFLFNKDRPHYMNYGGIGNFIAHEVTHGFDDQGKYFDKEGNLVEWWANETDKAYMEKAKCIIDQYSAITVPEFGLNLNGAYSQGENIADNGGIKEAYLAYNIWVERNGVEPTLPGLNFTAQQLFWISAANCWCSKQRREYFRHTVTTDEHSPDRYRVLVPFANTDYFAKDFNCPVGSKMNPIHKCQVW